MHEIFAQVQSFPVKSSLDLTGLDRTWQVHSFRPSPALLAQVQVVLAQVQHFGPSPALSSQVQRFPPKSSTFQPSPALFSQVQHFSAKSSTFAPSPALLDQAKVTSHAHVTSRKPGFPSLEFPISKAIFSILAVISFN